MTSEQPWNLDAEGKRLWDARDSSDCWNIADLQMDRLATCDYLNNLEAQLATATAALAGLVCIGCDHSKDKHLLGPGLDGWSCSGGENCGCEYPEYVNNSRAEKAEAALAEAEKALEGLKAQAVYMGTDWAMRQVQERCDAALASLRKETE